MPLAMTPWFILVGIIGYALVAIVGWGVGAAIDAARGSTGTAKKIRVGFAYTTFVAAPALALITGHWALVGLIFGVLIPLRVFDQD